MAPDKQTVKTRMSHKPKTSQNFADRTMTVAPDGKPHELLLIEKYAICEKSLTENPPKKIARIESQF